MNKKVTEGLVNSKIFRIFDSNKELNVGNQPNKPTKLQ